MTLSLRNFVSVILLLFCSLNFNCSRKTDSAQYPAIVDQVTFILPDSVKIDTVKFNDYISENTYSSLRLRSSGQYNEPPLPDTMVNRFNSIFNSLEWEPAWDYAADGPTGTGFGYSKSDSICVIKIDFEVAGYTNDKSDEPGA